MVRLNEIILPAREPHTGDAGKDSWIQGAKLGFWASAAAISLLTCARFPILKKMGKISKRTMWIGVGVSGGVGAVGSILSAKAWICHSRVQWRKRVDDFLENTSNYESKLLDAYGPFERRSAIKALNKVEERLQQAENPVGLVWKVTGAGGREHYLIGACTTALNRAMIDQENVQEALENTETFVSELGSELVNGFYRKRNKVKTASEGFCIGVTQEALKRQMEIRALETLDERIERLQWEENDFREDMRRKIHAQRVTHGWHLGDLHKVEKQFDHVNYQEFVDYHERVSRWMHTGVPGLDGQNIIDFLNSSDDPCCVLVGAITCVGKHGILQMLTEAGFTVERTGQAGKRSRG